MAVLSDAAREVLESGRLAHIVTLNSDGSPQVTIVWIGLEGDEIVSGHLKDHLKLRNVRRDPRVVVSLESGGSSNGLAHYLVIRGTGRVTEGGAPELLQRLAHVYLGPEVSFPPPGAPRGYVLRITPTESVASARAPAGTPEPRPPAQQVRGAGTPAKRAAR